MLLAALLIRGAFIAYAVWHDARFVVKYTDIDYIVFTDAARFVTEGASPFRRATYRYTPLLAQLLTPNIWLQETWGKCLFALFDLLIGGGIYLLSMWRGLSRGSCLLASMVWLFNPLSFNISTRGNADSIPSVLVVLTLLFLASKRHRLAGIAFGAAVHVKIYPVVYALALYLCIPVAKRGSPGLESPFRSFFHRSRLEFALSAASTFFAITYCYYWQYGFEFLYETYIYHFVRTDHRHNFSVYFYQMYLSSALSSVSYLAAISRFSAFLPQVVLIVSTSLRYRADPFFATFLLTYIFVIFNKVCTAQYFVWYLALLPLVLPGLAGRLKFRWTGILLILSFFAGQGLWLNFAYRLEILGENTFLQVWAAGVVFFLVNIGIALTLIRAYTMQPLFNVATGKILDIGAASSPSDSSSRQRSKP